MNTQLLAVNNSALSVDLVPDALTLKTSALEMARTVQGVGDQFTLDCAADALAGLSDLLKLVESSRVAVKEPVLKLGRDIDAKAKAFIAELESEKGRISLLCSNFHLAQREKAREAERLRQAELRRLEDEKRALEAKTFTAPPAEAKRAEAQIAVNQQQAAAVAAAPVAVAPIRSKGLQTRESWVWECVDIRELVKFSNTRPDKASLFEVVPSKAAIEAAIAAGERTIPGLKIEKRVTTFASR